MYKGTNPTAVRSQRRLAHAMLEELGEAPYGSITVTKICRSAGLSRQTFYQLFESKEDVLRFVLQKAFAHIGATLSEFPRGDIRQRVRVLTEFFSQRKDLVRALADNKLDRLFFHELYEALVQLPDWLPKGYPEAVHSYCSAFVAGAIASTMLNWFTAPEPLTAEEVAELITRMFTGRSGEYRPPEEMPPEGGAR